MSKDPKEKKGSRQTSFVSPVCHGWISQATAHGCQPEDQIYFRSLHLENMWKKRGRRRLSAALTISHASADGYHASMFFERLQEVLDEFVIDQ